MINFDELEELNLSGSLFNSKIPNVKKVKNLVAEKLEHKGDSPISYYYDAIISYFNEHERKIKIIEEDLKISPDIFLPKHFVKYYEQSGNYDYETVSEDFIGASEIFKKFLGISGKHNKNGCKIELELHEQNEIITKINGEYDSQRSILFKELCKKFLYDTYNINKFVLKRPRKFKFTINMLDNICSRVNGNINYDNISRCKLALKSIFYNEAYLDYHTLKSKLNSNNIKLETVGKELLNIEDEEVYTLPSLFKCEEKIAINVIELIKKEVNKQIKLNNKTGLDSNQIDIANYCLNKYLSIIIGGPGTGKTQVIGRIVRSCENILICSFMGSAIENIKVRLDKEENTARLDEICMTLHSFKQRYFNYLKNENDENKKFDESYIAKYLKKDIKIFIIDEFSMVDIKLFSKILDIIIKHNIRLILIGDYNQLPSIGPGNLLYDLVEFGKKYDKLPIHNLTKVYRSENTINILTKIINEDYLDLTTPYLKYINSNSIKKYLGKLNLYEFFKKMENIIICPTNESVDLYNKEIQKYNDGKYLCCGFKQGDKIMCNTNISEHNLYNGSVFILSDVEIHIGKNEYVVENGKYNKGCWLKGISEITVYLKGRKSIKLKVSDFSDYFNLGYARTVHKSQGKEYENVFLLFDDYPQIMWDKKLLYTAISRTKKNCYISGNFYHLINSCKRNKIKISLIDILLKKYISVNYNEKSNEIIARKAKLDKSIQTIQSNLPDYFIKHINYSDDINDNIRKYETIYKELIEYNKISNYSKDPVFNWIYDQQLSIENELKPDDESVAKSLFNIFAYLSKSKVKVEGNVIYTWNDNVAAWYTTSSISLILDILKPFFKKLKEFVILEQSLYKQNGIMDKNIDINYTERIKKCDMFLDMIKNYSNYISKFINITQKFDELFGTH